MFRIFQKPGWMLVFLLFSLTVLLSPDLVGQDKKSNQGDGKKSAAKKTDPLLTRQLRSPRQTVITFLQAMDDGQTDQAIKCLDLSGLDADTASTKAKVYADKLHLVLKRVWDIEVWRLSDEDDARSPVLLSDSIDTNTDQQRLADAQKIVIARDEDGLWRFTAETLTVVDEEIWSRWNDQLPIGNEKVTSFPVWLESQFPPSLRKKHFFLPTYQWICLGILIVAGFAIDIFVRYILNFLTNLWFRFVKTEVDFKARRNLWKPVGLLTQSLVWYLGARMIDLPASWLSVLLVAFKLFAVISAVWTAFRAIALLKSHLERRAAKTVSKYDDLLIPFITTALKVLSIAVGLILLVDVFEGPWKTVWGGLGVGGIAFAIAAKDVLGNLFGSLTVLTERPFEIGDWVIIDDVEGTVESVGLRSSKIRTFYNSVVVMPNSILTTAVVDNMGRRRYRRLRAMIGLQYDTTPEQVEAFCEGVRELIRNYKYTRKDGYYVYLNELADHSINILLYMFFRCPEWEIELEQRHQLLLDIMKLAEQLDVKFAFPTRTLHMFNEETDDPSSFPEGTVPDEFGRQIASDIASQRKSA